MNSETMIILGVVVFAALIAWSVISTVRGTLAQAEFIRNYALPPGIYRKLESRRAGLREKDFQLVIRALQQFFLAYHASRHQFVAMPSKVVDELWHEFILYTREYRDFCDRAFGRFLDHAPAVALGPDRSLNAGLRRVWWQACKQENINPRVPSRLPLLFAIDAKLGIAGGFRYSAGFRPQGSAADVTGSSAGHGVGAGAGTSTGNHPYGSLPGSGDAGRGGADAGDFTRAAAVITAGAMGAAMFYVGDFADPSLDGGTDGFGDAGASGSSSSDSGFDGGGGCGGGGCGGGGGD